jgi:hypothetical protein
MRLEQDENVVSDVANFGVLANHSYVGQRWWRAVLWTKLAGQHAVSVHAYREAVKYFETAYEVLSKHESEVLQERAIEQREREALQQRRRVIAPTVASDVKSGMDELFAGSDDRDERPLIVAHLARAKYALGRYPECIPHFREALSLYNVELPTSERTALAGLKGALKAFFNQSQCVALAARALRRESH